MHHQMTSIKNAHVIIYNGDETLAEEKPLSGTTHTCRQN